MSFFIQCCFQHFGIHMQKKESQPNELKNTQKKIYAL